VAQGLTDKDAADRLARSIGRLTRQLRHEVEATTNLGPRSLAALGSIRAHGPLTLGQLARLEHVTAPTMTRVVERLETDGHVVREPNPNDRRVVLLSITRRGRATLDAARRARSAWLARLLGHLDADQRHRVVDALEALELLASQDSAIDTEPQGATS
jgi:DNA-binding MarR family transcriptional regulator